MIVNVDTEFYKSQPNSELYLLYLKTGDKEILEILQDRDAKEYDDLVEEGFIND